LWPRPKLASALLNTCKVSHSPSITN
jgi:hypothetical protein